MHFTLAKYTFKDFIFEWKNKYSSELSSNTRSNYMSIINAYLNPVFGNMRLDEVKTMHIVNYLDSLKNIRRDGKEGGLSAESINYHRRILKNIFSRAYEWKLIKNNPVEGVKKRKTTKQKTEVYSTEEVHELLELLQDQIPQMRLIVTLAITCGLRRSEILGLSWDDIDFENNAIWIRHSLIYTEENGYELKDTKTEKSDRIIIAPDFLMNQFKKHKMIKNTERLKASDLWEGGEHFFVFSTWNGKPYFPDYIGTWWRRFLKRTGFKKIRFHDLRHTAATLLINQGVHTKIISERLGHANIQTTMNIYGHYLREADKEVANTLEKLFNTNS